MEFWMQKQKVKKYNLGANISFLALSIVFSSNLAYAQDKPNESVPTPVNVTPSVPTPVKVDFDTDEPIVQVVEQIPQNDNQALAWGLKAAKDRKWSEIRRLMTYVKDNDIKNALEWCIISSENNDAGFSETSQALTNLIGFPQMRDVRIRLEKNIENYGLSNKDKINFLMRKEAVINNDGPISGEGQMALAYALLSEGNTELAQKYASNAWRKYRFDSALQSKYFTRFANLLTTKDHDERVNLLLWLDKQSQAKDLLPYVSEQMRINANLRLGIVNEEGAVLSGPSLSDLGITYERIKRLRKADRDSEALDLLASTNWSSLPEIAQEDLWEERRRLLIEAIRSKRWNDAYKIVSQHGLNTGAKAAEGEQTAGWIALRFLNQPQLALKHYQRFDTLVSTSMSKARGYYWQGRAYEALGQDQNANDAYMKAANYSTFYYGQLGAARLGQRLGRPAILNLPPDLIASAQDRAMLNAQPMMKIARTLNDIGERDLFVKFAFSLDDVLTTNGEHQALSEYARQNGENLVGIRVAKAGLNRGILATEAAFPVIQIPRIIGYHQAEDAFSLAITRQESEFNERARSKVGALGLMQFMPATAATQARKMGVEHQTSWLTAKPQHNLMLGSAHLADLVDNFYGSYVLTIIAYNAGPGRSIKWIDTYGEIRGGTDVDKIIDWVEMIPFSETRNYVQRVMENMQVYRARLNKGTAQIDILNDLARGVKPPPTFSIKIMPGAYSEGGPVEEPKSNKDPEKDKDIEQ